MDSNLLVGVQLRQLSAGHRLLAQLVRDKFDIMAAFWAETAEDHALHLYIATPQVDQEGLIKPYTRLQGSLTRSSGRPLSLSDVNLIGTTDSITKNILKIIELDSDQTGVTLGQRLLGDLFFEWVYIYPRNFYHEQPDSSAMPEDVFKHVFDLLNRGPGPFLPSRVALRDGDCFEGVPISFSMGIDQASVVQFRVASESIPRVVPAQEIVSIQ